MGVYAIRWAFSAPIQSPGAKFLLVALAEHARGPEGEDWTCFPSVKRLARWTAQGERTIERHLNWLITEGWISRQLRRHRRRGESAYFYILHRAKVAADGHYEEATVEVAIVRSKPMEERHFATRQTDTLHPPTSTQPPAKLASAYMDEPGIEPVSEPTLGQKLDVEDPFEVFWSAYPNKVEERGARRLFASLVRRGEVTADQLLAGARAYAGRVDGRSLTFIKSPMSWLANGCWADIGNEPRPDALSEAAPLVFAGPLDVWSTVTKAKGTAWAASYLAPCGWIATTRTLRPRTGVAAKKLRAEIGTLLRRLSVSVSEPTLALGDAHVQ